MGLFKKSLTQIKKIFLFRVSMNCQKDWKAKVERPHFLKIQSDRITVWCALRAIFVGNSNVDLFLKCDTYLEGFTISNASLYICLFQLVVMSPSRAEQFSVWLGSARDLVGSTRLADFLPLFYLLHFLTYKRMTYLKFNLRPCLFQELFHEWSSCG